MSPPPCPVPTAAVRRNTEPCARRRRSSKLREARFLPGAVSLKKHGAHVPFQMVDRDQRLSQTLCQGLCRRLLPLARPRPGPARGSLRWHRRPAAHTGPLQRLANNRHDASQVLPRSQFRHHAAILPVYIYLRGHDTGQDLAAVRDDGGGRLIARRLDSKDTCHRL